ncbi:hypothetical protein [Thermosynechococcus sp.]|uniref:hypothetical protein n=1 Tax=Thermosynechococcus sp. TaxID=2814275 RepID=UPI003918EAF3
MSGSIGSTTNAAIGRKGYPLECIKSIAFLGAFVIHTFEESGSSPLGGTGTEPLHGAWQDRPYITTTTFCIVPAFGLFSHTKPVPRRAVATAKFRES